MYSVNSGKLLTLLLSCAVVVATGCASSQVTGDGGGPVNISQLPGGQSADATLMVDCLLPGKIKKLGSSVTYVTPRRPIMASAQECEIRGGEYAAYDRANYKTALKVWQPLAEQGDRVAQTHVGTIYEKGLGVQPDYTTAAKWYKMAAEQGYPRAQNALAYLYEVGLGVEKNPQEAFRWYRRASGFKDEDLPVMNIAINPEEQTRLQEARKAEEKRLAKLQQTIASKNQELDSVSQRLDTAKAKLDRASKDKAPELAKINAQQQAREKELQARIRDLELKASNLGAEVKSKEQSLALTAASLEQKQANAEEKSTELRQLTSEVSTRRTVLAKELEELQQAKLELDKKQKLVQSQSEKLTISGELDGIVQQLITKERELADVDKALNTQKRLAGSKGKELNKFLSEVAKRKGALQAELKQIEQEKQELALKRDKMEKIKMAESRRWQQERESQIQELRKQQQLISQLEKRRKQNQNHLADLNRVKSHQQLAMLSPRIEMVDPLIPVTRGIKSSTSASASAAGNSNEFLSTAPPVVYMSKTIAERDIVGKVISPKGLLMLTVNDQKTSVDKNGLFKTTMEIPTSGTLVDVIAVDTIGNRTEKKFVLAPQASRFSSSNATGIIASKHKRSSPSALKFGNYYALLIGNNEYKNLPDLKTPINDITVIGKTLKQKYGFKEVRTLKNASRYQIITAMNKLRSELTEKDNLLIYYAGHGELDRVNMRGQWLPVDAEEQSTANWISNSSLTELVNAIPAKHVMIVADSCYSGIMTRSTLTNIESGRTQEARMNWIGKIVGKRSRTVLTSGGVAPVLDEGGGKHSVFARSFLKALQQNSGILEGQRLYREVSATVALAADRYNVEQVPEYAPIKHAGHESGDFFLVPII